MQQLRNLPALDVIDYATKGTAEILGIGDITGTLQVGKSADFIVLAKNPLDDLHNIKRPEQVVAMGKHYPNPHFKEYPGKDNGVIPHQLHEEELVKILGNASA